MPYEWKNYSLGFKIKEGSEDGCDSKKHPPFKIRPYRKGNFRCLTCGNKRSIISILEERLKDDTAND